MFPGETRRALKKHAGKNGPDAPAPRIAAMQQPNSTLVCCKRFQSDTAKITATAKFQLSPSHQRTHRRRSKFQQADVSPQAWLRREYPIPGMSGGFTFRTYCLPPFNSLWIVIACRIVVK